MRHAIDMCRGKNPAPGCRARPDVELQDSRMTRSFSLRPLAAALALLAAGTVAAGTPQPARPTLTGWAQMPAATFADGPTSGRFITPNPYGTNLPPYADRQPVQGFSGVLPGPTRDTVRVIADNGFGTRANSADALLRAYALRIAFRTARGGTGTVAPADWTSGLPARSFSRRTRLALNDANQQLGLPIQADLEHFYGNPAHPPVDEAIRGGRLLTGADLDIESVRRDKRGHYWFGDEFGPYLVKTDASGTVLRPAIPLPGVYAPQHRDVVAGTATANLGSSGGFEGLALNQSGTRLYALLEKTVAGDPAGTLRINEFDLAGEAYTGTVYTYPLEAADHAIGDMSAVDDQRFLVIERNGGTATNGVAPFKKIFLVDIEGVANGAPVRKTELVDLMSLADPHDLDRDGSTTFTFPYVTIEDVLVLDERTLLVINDNNFPGGGGRELASDRTEFLRIALPRRLQDCGPQHPR
jgi:hypothetical protein